MATPDLPKEFIVFAGRLADAAAKETLPLFRSGAQVFNKAGIWFDPVTDADREAERAQRRLINAMYPKHGIVGEEFGMENDDAEWRWVLDPVDGTRAFVCGVASWATLIGLEQNGQPVLGVIEQPFTGERWVGVGDTLTYSHRGKSQPKTSSGITELSKARLSTTDPRRNAYFSKVEWEAFGEIAGNAQVARFSLDAYSYALLAIGELDLVIESGLKHHDYAALLPVIEAGGGVVSNWKGDAVGKDDRGRIVAAATPELHDQALKVLKQV